MVPFCSVLLVQGHSLLFPNTNDQELYNSYRLFSSYLKSHNRLTLFQSLHLNQSHTQNHCYINVENGMRSDAINKCERCNHSKQTSNGGRRI